MPDLSAQLIDQVQTARSENRPLEIIGGASKRFLGREPQGDPLTIGGHRGIVAYHPIELVLTARAGTPLSEIETALAEQGQTLAFEPPRFGDQATLGGTLACNLAGPARPWSGSMRDLLLGIRLINGQGEHLRFGGQVMKNVAGFDISRLQAGAMGTLGVITEVSLKVLPKPAASLTLVLAMDAEEAIQLMNAKAAEPKPLTGACWLDGQLYLRLAGARRAVEGTAEQWRGDLLEDADNFWSALRDQTLPFFGQAAPLWRFSIRSTGQHLHQQHPWLIDWAGAQRWLSGDFDPIALQASAREAGGTVSLYRGGDRSAEVFQAQPKVLQQIQQRLKNAFDPEGLFNPGRLYSWL